MAETGIPLDHAARIAELIDRLGRLARELQYVDGLNPAQWEALRYLSRANKYSRTPGACAEFLGSTKGTVSQTVTALESKGLICRTASPRDRRVCLIDLTDEGRRMIARDPVLKLEQIAAAMHESETEPMVRGLGRLLAMLQLEMGARPFGTCSACSRHLSPDQGCATSTARCGMTGEPLTRDDASRICANYATAAE
ncbi:MAG: MarR family transcriptional regulator [Pseudomonadota bacterium]|nr:MarR family transcriptional regulator [Pseudomonadota bacterium]